MSSTYAEDRSVHRPTRRAVPMNIYLIPRANPISNVSCLVEVEALLLEATDIINVD